MPSDERLTIETPEQVVLELPVAGIGSRFLAIAVDTVLQFGLVAAAVLALVFFSRAGVPRLLPVAPTVAPALLLIFLFCLYWGYFAFFEIIWSGRTPGKRLSGIRVVKESGRPINAYEAIGRNVLRAVDILPALYAAGIVCMLLNRHSRRIGDYVAGTVVVHDKPLDTLRPNWIGGRAEVESNAPLPQLTAEELVLVETYLQRRFDLDPWVRDQRAAQIAARITAKSGLRRDPDEPVDEFLERVARRIRDNARFR